jgi:beta-mannosidase
VGDEAWIPAAVPGCVHTDLLAAGKIADPFFGTNEKRLGWIERQDWQWRTRFSLSARDLAPGRHDLVFDGLDTFAEVALNGRVLLAADNMFRRWRVPVTEALRAGDNELQVTIRSPLLATRAAAEALGFPLEAINDQGDPKLSVFARKAPYQYGWDWGPRLVTSGIWRPVRLESWDDVRIDDVHVRQLALDDARASLAVLVTLEAAHPGRALVSAEVAGEARAGAEVALAAGMSTVTLDLVLERPRRWWPGGLGQPHLYAVAAAVETARGRQVAGRRLGLRTVRLLHQRDAQGKSFTFEVNGAPVFMKGANWIPADSFPSRVTPERYRLLLSSAAAAHMNMLRVWGGGIYEDDVFYDLCDELGILVWQDFMFACSLYPDDDPFVENVRREAVDNVRRLRNHACLALWAGNNEIEAAWHHWGWKVKYGARGLAERIWAGYQRLFHRVLPEVVAEHDPGRPYTGSSPSANEEGHVNERGWGDMHYWGVWHLKLPYSAYDQNVSRFMSEYGFQSFPEPATVASFTRPEDRRADSEVMAAHQRHRHGNALIAAYLDQELGPARDFEAFLYLSQVLQAEAVKYGAEAHRRAMPACMGSLFWQLDDCWPVASWSGIDHHGRWKALHHYARRFFAPVLLTVRREHGEVVVHGVSDRLAPLAARLRVRALTFDGACFHDHQAAVALPPNAATPLYRAPLATLVRGRSPRESLIVAELLEGDAPLARNILYLAPAREQRLPPPGLEVEVAADGEGPQVTLAAARLARSVWLSSPEAGRFADNHFDLLPGERTRVAFTPAGPLDLAAFRRGLRITTLVDAFSARRGPATAWGEGLRFLRRLVGRDR